LSSCRFGILFEREAYLKLTEAKLSERKHKTHAARLRWILRDHVHGIFVFVRKKEWVQRVRDKILSVVMRRLGTLRLPRLYSTNGSDNLIDALRPSHSCSEVATPRPLLFWLFHLFIGHATRVFPSALLVLLLGWTPHLRHHYPDVRVRVTGNSDNELRSILLLEVYGGIHTRTVQIRLTSRPRPAATPPVPRLTDHTGDW